MHCALTVLKNIAGFAFFFLLMGGVVLSVGLLAAVTVSCLGIDKSWFIPVFVSWLIIGAGTVTGVIECRGRA